MHWQKHLRKSLRSEADSFDLSRTLHTATGCQGTAVLVRRLIEAGADVDEPYLTSNLIRMLLAVKGTVKCDKRDLVL